MRQCDCKRIASADRQINMAIINNMIADMEKILKICEDTNECVDFSVTEAKACDEALSNIYDIALNNYEHRLKGMR